jgi:hypothetical protein
MYSTVPEVGREQFNRGFISGGLGSRYCTLSGLCKRGSLPLGGRGGGISKVLESLRRIYTGAVGEPVCTRGRGFTGLRWVGLRGLCWQWALRERET